MKEVSYDGPPEEEQPSWKPRETRSRGNERISPIRTYRMDVDQLIKEKKPTATEIVMAEQKKKLETGGALQEKPQGESHFGAIIFVLLLVLAFAGGVGFYILFGANKTPSPGSTENPAAPQQKIKASTITISGSPREQVLADIAIAINESVIPPGSSRPINFVNKIGGDQTPASASLILNALAATPLDESLTNSLENNSLFEIYALAKPACVFIVGTRSYASTFSGMLKWEKQMPRDFMAAINPITRDRTVLLQINSSDWKDERISGIDARVLRASEGTAVLMYAIVDKKTLIISGSDTALEAYIQKYSHPKP